jgi:low affinity Fe/Cu permease
LKKEYNTSKDALQLKIDELIAANSELNTQLIKELNLNDELQEKILKLQKKLEENDSNLLVNHKTTVSIYEASPEQTQGEQLEKNQNNRFNSSTF